MVKGTDCYLHSLAWGRMNGTQFRVVNAYRNPHLLTVGSTSMEITSYPQLMITWVGPAPRGLPVAPNNFH